jgi:hypothetical protein
MSEAMKEVAAERMLNLFFHKNLRTVLTIGLVEVIFDISVPMTV